MASQESQKHLSGHMTALYETYKTKTNQVIEWLKKATGTTEDNITVRKMVAMADKVAADKIDVPNYLYFALFSATLKRDEHLKLHEQRKASKRRKVRAKKRAGKVIPTTALDIEGSDDSDGFDTSLAGHVIFNQELKGVLQTLFPDGEPSPPPKRRIEPPTSPRNSKSTKLSENPFEPLEDTSSRTTSPQTTSPSDRTDAPNYAPPVEAVVLGPRSAILLVDMVKDDSIQVNAILSRYILECDELLGAIRSYWTDAAKNRRNFMQCVALTNAAFQTIRIFTWLTIQATEMKDFDGFIQQGIIIPQQFMVDHLDFDAMHPVSAQRNPFAFGYGQYIPQAALHRTHLTSTLKLKSESPKSRGLTMAAKTGDEKNVDLVPKTHYPRMDRDFDVPSITDWNDWLNEKPTSECSTNMEQENHYCTTHFPIMRDLIHGLAQVKHVTLEQIAASKVDRKIKDEQTSYKATRLQMAPLLAAYDEYDNNETGYNSRPLADIVALNCGLTFLLESQKSFHQTEKVGSPSCHTRACAFVAEVQTEFENAMQHFDDALLNESIRIHIDGFREDLKDVSQMLTMQSYESNAYLHAPWPAGSVMLDINNAAMSLGTIVADAYQLLPTILHAYNFLKEGKKLNTIPILDELCILLENSVFLGKRPTEDHSGHWISYVQQQAKIVGTKDCKSMMGLCTFSKIRLLKAWDYRPTVIYFKWAAGVDLDEYTNCHGTHESLQTDTAGILLPVETDFTKQSAKWGINVMKKLKKKLQEDMRGKLPVTEINWFRVYVSCHLVMEHLHRTNKLQRTVNSWTKKKVAGAQLLVAQALSRVSEVEDPTLKVRVKILTKQTMLEVQASIEEIFKGPIAKCDHYRWKNI